VTDTDIDPITLEVYWNRLVTLMGETDQALLRTAFSTIISETRDFGFTLLDEEGVGLAQSLTCLPVFAGILPYTARALLERFPPPTLQDGDVLCTNDPWIAAGHLPDFCFVRPIFHRGRIVAHVASLAHMADNGGNISYFDARDVFEEGLNLPPCRLFRAGVPSEELFAVLRANVRVPDLVVGDLWAMRAALHVAAERVGEFLEEYGLTDLRAIARSIRRRSADAMRRAIARIPSGAYRHAVVCDGYGGQSATVAATLTVDGERLTVDYDGTSPETLLGAINCSMNYTRGSTFVALKAALVPEIPANEALFEPVEVVAPLGCILNCRPPVAVKGRSAVAVHTHDAIFGALAPVIPDQVQAGAGTFWGVWALGRHPDGRAFNAAMIVNGGIGGSGRRDGLSATSYPWNSVATSSEIYENHAPILVLRKELVPGSAGVGRFRGGLGQRLVFRPAGETPVTVGLRPVNLRFPPPGLRDGPPGTLGRVLWNGEATAQNRFELHAGDEVTCELPGGGGFGAPEARDPALRARDAAQGYVA
jgi:N-methylhydantoinase B/oxoprolinase/acetone carboxylase alpha subunit